MNTVLFIILLIISSCSSFCFLKNIQLDLDGRKASKRMETFTSLSRGAAVFLFFIALSAAVGLIYFGVYSQGFVLLGFSAAVSMILSEMNKRSKSPLFATAAKVLLIASVLEVTLFNSATYRLFFGNYHKNHRSFKNQEGKCHKNSCSSQDINCCITGPIVYVIPDQDRICHDMKQPYLG